MFIDKNSGAIELPNGLVITAELTKARFENSAYFSQVTPHDYGTLPFQWYRFDGGQVDGHTLHVDLCFYSDVLIDFQVTTNFYGANQRKWEDFSLEIEAQSKTFHDELLQKILGKPHKKFLLPLENGESVLDYRMEYSYAWGIVWSVYDSKGGFAYIGVKYGSRHENANKDYRTKKA